MGGKAIKNTTRINQENVRDTMEDIYCRLIILIGIKTENTSILGSTGKKKMLSSSGDIDLAVSVTAILKNNKNLKTKEDAIRFVAEKANLRVDNVRILKGIGIVTMGWPIINTDGKQSGEVVQLDLMMTDNVEFASWMYFSPNEYDSPYKGLYRNSLLSAISHYANRQGDNEEWSRFMLHFEKGLSRVKESRRGKKGLLKNPKVLERSESIKDADVIVHILLGPSFNASEIMTFEDILSAFMSRDFIWKDYRSEIAKMVIIDLNKKEFPIPKEIRDIAYETSE